MSKKTKNAHVPRKEFELHYITNNSQALQCGKTFNSRSYNHSYTILTLPSSITFIEDYESWIIRIEDKEYAAMNGNKYTRDNIIHLNIKFKSLETAIRYIKRNPYLAKIINKYPAQFRFKGE